MSSPPKDAPFRRTNPPPNPLMAPPIKAIRSFWSVRGYGYVGQKSHQRRGEKDAENGPEGEPWGELPPRPGEQRDVCTADDQGDRNAHRIVYEHGNPRDAGIRKSEGHGEDHDPDDVYHAARDDGDERVPLRTRNRRRAPEKSLCVPQPESFSAQ